MKAPNEKQAASEIIPLLADLFRGSLGAIRVRHVGDSKPYDFAISVSSLHFIAEYKSNASTGSVAAAIEGLKRLSTSSANAGFPLVVVPYMGDVGRQLCDNSEISWLDLSGNARIVAPGLNIWIEGRPNKFIERGRPPNVFAAKSSRIARQLLFHSQRFQTQVELARQTRMDDGYVSKIVRRLGEEHYLDSNDQGGVRPRDPNVLLDAWHGGYDFNRQRIIKGHVPARTGDELLQRVVNGLVQVKLQWAATGLSAAWLYTGFAAFRLATVYLSAMPPRSLLKEMDFSDESKGANLWLVLPDDEGVFQGSQTLDGVQCVSAVQAYLDLKAHPERAKEAAAELRKKFLTWGRHDA